MPLSLGWIMDSPILPGTKGVPPEVIGLPLAALSTGDWSVLRGDVPMPAATLRRDLLDANAARMQAYLAARHAVCAPHGKTTMCPQLYERQLDAGAWAITVATVAQAQLCHAVAVPRVIVANEIVGDTELAMFADLCAADGSREYISLIDSSEGALRLQAAFAARPGCAPANVLIEFGMNGGRCGLRTGDDVLALARAVTSLDRLALRGIEGYEGLIVSDDATRDAAVVSDYLDDLIEAFDRCRAEGLFAPAEQPIISAGGSVYYDIVAALGRRSLADAALLVVRSGSYLIQDDGFYARALTGIVGRGAAPNLEPALLVWVRVLSLPEPGLAILSAGKRDLSFDIDLPVPKLVQREGEPPGPIAMHGWSIVQLSDQHAFARAQATGASSLRIGDMVALGISHPCTTFDKWSVLLEVDEQYRVVGGLRTFF